MSAYATTDENILLWNQASGQSDSAVFKHNKFSDWTQEEKDAYTKKLYDIDSVKESFKKDRRKAVCKDGYYLDTTDATKCLKCPAGC